MGTAATAFVGIDVSRDALDACLLSAAVKTRESTFPNTPSGHAALVAGADLHFCMEATGPDSEAPATHLADTGRLVSVANPTRVKYAGLMCGRGNKTDRADARLIAEYAAREKSAAWRPPPPEVRELQTLVRRIDDLVEMAAREKGWLASPALTRSARTSVGRTVRLPGKEAAALRAAADELVAPTPALRSDRDLLESIPGVGRPTATTILAELPAAERLPSGCRARVHRYE